MDCPRKPFVCKSDSRVKGRGLHAGLLHSTRIAPMVSNNPPETHNGRHNQLLCRSLATPGFSDPSSPALKGFAAADPISPSGSPALVSRQDCLLRAASAHKGNGHTATVMEEVGGLEPHGTVPGQPLPVSSRQPA